MTRIITTLLAAAALSIPAAAARATTIYDTIGPGDAYRSDMGWIVGNPGNGAKYSSFAQFSPTQSGYLSSALAPIWNFYGEDSPIRFELRSDEDGHPGTVIASTLASIPTDSGVVSGSFLGDVWLSDHDTYWFGLATTSPTSGLGWYQNPVGVVGSQAFAGALWQAPGDWFVQTGPLGAFQLDARIVSEVPEPSTTALTALGVLLLAVRSAGAMRRTG